ncbi:MAG: TRAP transporter substrate-binding protein DctP, partial [Spirochaetales bacterium]|nr:TRAP transporter substrate-binding protein DctP [Spirochaetales bacterium]
MKKVTLALVLVLILTTVFCLSASATELNVEGKKMEIALFAASLPENTPTGAGIKAMTEYINANSNGTITALDYYDTALGDASSLVEALKMDTVDIGVAGTAYFSSLVPEIEVFQLPFLFS